MIFAGANESCVIVLSMHAAGPLVQLFELGTFGPMKLRCKVDLQIKHCIKVLRTPNRGTRRQVSVRLLPCSYTLKLPSRTQSRAVSSCIAFAIMFCNLLSLMHAS